MSSGEGRGQEAWTPSPAPPVSDKAAWHSAAGPSQSSRAGKGRQRWRFEGKEQNCLHPGRQDQQRKNANGIDNKATGSNTPLSKFAGYRSTV